MTALTSTPRLRLPRHRTLVKWLHWLILPLFIWFLFVTPEDVLQFGQGAFQFHSVLGLIFVTLTLIWTALTLRRGLAGRPGPKLSPRLKRLHRAMHITLIWGLFGVAFTGFLLGLTSTVQLWAGGIVPIGVPLGLPSWNHVAGVVHIYEFYATAALVIGHATFHIWRHLKLHDNALRIMVPKALHKWL